MKTTEYPVTVCDLYADFERVDLSDGGFIDLRHIAAIAAQIVEGAYND